MELKSKNQIKFSNILSRMHKNFSILEGFFIIIRIYLTNNVIFYSISILLRFIPLIIISGDFIPSKRNKTNNKNIYCLLKKLLLHNLIKNLHLSIQFYLIVYILFYLLFCLRIINYCSILWSLKNKNFMNDWPLPAKSQIIMDHILLLLLPFIIEFLTFPYYIYFFPENILVVFDNKIEIYIIMIINTLLIILYNFNICIIIFCANKKYTIVEEEVYSQIINTNSINDKTIVYKSSNFIVVIIIILQNYVVFQNLESYIKESYKLYYKTIILITLFILFFIIIIKSAKDYNYNNFINILINLLFLFCFYTIIFEIIIYAVNYVIKNIILDIILILMKLFLSYITNRLFIFRRHKILETNLNEILFQEKNKNNESNENYLIDSLFYLNELMQEINMQKDSKSCISLFGLLSQHIKSCDKIKCNCKLLNKLIYRESITDIIIVLNYLIESTFLEYKYFTNYEMNILLAEHFCHLKNNPILAFSIIKSYIINNRNELSKFKIIDLYELCQKYVYYIKAMDKFDKRRKHFLEFYLNYYRISKISNKVKIIMNYYVETILKILKYKNIFEESLDIKYDENNEFVENIKINFFQQNSYIENESNNLKISKLINNENDSNNFSNLYKIIGILKLCQKYYDDIIDYIKVMSLFKNLPIYILYKFHIFFDIFEGGKIPEEISHKLYYLLLNNINSNTNKTKNKIYDLLKERYNEQNNCIDSKFYAIYEYKIELIIKYFNEEFSLRLGFRQKEIINKKIDILMPNEFSNSHQKVIKKIIIGEQMKIIELKKSYIFNKDTKILYSVIPKAILIYGLSKNLDIIYEIAFVFEKEYNFMLNNNFKLLSLSKNFEDEYSLNKDIFELYDLKFLEILGLKLENIHKKFEQDFKSINCNNNITKIKTEEYIISQMYTQSGEKNNAMFKISNFIKNKNYFLENNETNEVDNDINENEEIIKLMSAKKDILDILKKNRKANGLVINNSFSMCLNKYKFIENLFKQITKIPENEISNDNNSSIYKLILNSKTLIKKSILSANKYKNDFIHILINLKYYYDKPFYFITIKDDKKCFIKLQKNINKKQKIKSIKVEYKSRNIKKTKFKMSNIIDDDGKTRSKLIIENEINKYKKEINQKRFMFIIESVTFSIILFNFIIYISMLIYQKNANNIIANILLSYYYNTYTRGIMLTIYSELNGIFHDVSGINNQNIVVVEDDLKLYSINIRKKFFYFRQNYIDYNLFIGNSPHLLYKKVKLLKLKGYWEEIPFISEFSSDIDYIAHMINVINLTSTPEFKSDIKNFIFYHKKNNSNSDNKEKIERIHTIFIELLFYLGVNYEYTYKNLFVEINREIYSSYIIYVNKCNKVYFILEILGMILYVTFLIVMIFYLYNSNKIIVKLLIFLFLDISEKSHLKNNDNNNNNNYLSIRLKLLKFKYLIDDFDLKQLQNFFDEIDDINKLKYTNKTSQMTEIGESKNIIKVRNIPKNPNNFINNSSVQDIKKIESNSSLNNLISSDSKFFKNNLNKNASLKNTDKNDNKQLHTQTKYDINDIILNKSNKGIIVTIKRYIIIVVLLILIIFIYVIIKILNNIKYTSESNSFYKDFDIIITRYTNIHYYFITLKSLFMFDEKDQRWIDMMNTLEKINEVLESSNADYKEVLSHKISSYKEVQLLINILQYNKNDSVEYIKKNLCPNISSCHNYLESEDNIFSSGVESGLKICFTFINNIVMDYKQIDNKSNTEEIVNKITGTQFYEFKRLRKSFSYVLCHVKDMIYSSFENDQKIFRKKYKSIFYILNMISLFSSILIFIIFFFVSFSIKGFIKPIKDSTFRIKKCFYCIKIFRT